MVYLTPDDVMMHLIYKSFVQGHWFWISHGEIEHQQYDSRYSNSKIPEVGGSSLINDDYYESYVDRMKDMVDDGIITNQKVREEGQILAENHFIIWFKLFNNPYMMVVPPTVNSLLQ